MTKLTSSDYILDQRRSYSLYVIKSRAIPHVTDGLKSAARRVLWMARGGKKLKSSALAGSCAPIHPHSAPEGTINTIASPYGNNIPLLTGVGAFGTRLKPTSYGASRYTSVYVSKFTEEVVFADIELVPMMDNYDNTQKEPKHFLPLVPIVLLNPQEGIAVGFASNILPRSLADIVADQIKHLQGKKNIADAYPSFTPSNQVAIDRTINNQGKVKWSFNGSYDKVNATTIRIVNMPYGITHQKFIANLEKLEDDGTITDIIDDSSDEYNIVIKFKKGILSKLDDQGILNLTGLTTSLSENLNVIDFGGETVWTAEYTDIITKFTDWRLQYYEHRYARLSALLEVDIQRLEDILLAIKKNIGSIARKIRSKQELREYLSAIGIIDVDYIADLAIYRFTEDERLKTETKLDEANTLQDQYHILLSSEQERKKVYINELKQVLKKFG